MIDALTRTDEEMAKRSADHRDERGGTGMKKLSVVAALGAVGEAAVRVIHSGQQDLLPHQFPVVVDADALMQLAAALRTTGMFEHRIMDHVMMMGTWMPDGLMGEPPEGKLVP